jgi:ABC-type nickel/cobalt efflux system permease component RcnA
MIRALADIQQQIHAAVASYLAAFAASNDWGALRGILPLGIVFGAIHALTPGHSKMLLASYLVGSRLALVRGLAVSSVLATTHVVSSVLIALFAVHLLTRTLVGAGRAPLIEDISRGILILIGLWFVIRAIRGRSHDLPREGVAVGFVAGLIPCPLTLFVMVLALSRGVPAAGLTFAGSMFIGIALTLGLVAAASVLGRDLAVQAMARHGASIAAVGRWLDGIAGVLLIVLGAWELQR